MNIFFILGLLFLLLTLGVFLGGIISMSRGGDFNKKYGNRFMQARVACQALAILFLLLGAIST